MMRCLAITLGESDDALTCYYSWEIRLRCLAITLGDSDDALFCYYS